MKNKHKKPEKSSDAKAITKKEEVQRSKDERIDQDFPGFPHPPSAEKTINPKTEEDKVGANLKTKNETPDPEAGESVGSAGAFEATEGREVLRKELDDDKYDKKKKNNY